MSIRSVVRDSWPKDIDVGGDMITHVLLKLFLPPTETCKPDKKFSFFPSFFIKFGCSSVINI